MRKAHDLTGKKFGKLTALRPDGHIGANRAWLCQCDCDPEGKRLKRVTTGNLNVGFVKSCGCLVRYDRPVARRIDLTGQIFGRLTVLRLSSESKNRQRVWECQCSCDPAGERLRLIRSNSLRRGTSQSCGCLRREMMQARAHADGDPGSQTKQKETTMTDAKTDYAYRCPSCGDPHNLTVTITTTARLMQDDGHDNFETDTDDGDHEWDSNSSMWCKCGFSGVVNDFDALEYTYTVHLDERGEFRATVDNWKGETVFTLHNDGGEGDTLEDYGMKHKSDTENLLAHLQEVEIVPSNGRLAPAEL